MKYKDLYTMDDLQAQIAANDANLFYFSTPYCNVCKVIKPKLLEMMERQYPSFNMFYIDTEKSPFVAGQMYIFTVPTLLIYFKGKEFYRISRNISIEELAKTIKRPYELLA